MYIISGMVESEKKDGCRGKELKDPWTLLVFFFLLKPSSKSNWYIASPACRINTN